MVDSLGLLMTVKVHSAGINDRKGLPMLLENEDREEGQGHLRRSEFAEFGKFGAWLSIPFTVLIGWVYLMMELVGDYSENPFEGSKAA